MLKCLNVLAVLGVALAVGLPTNSSTKNGGPRIVGGDETDIERNPYQLALLYHNQHYCGAVEIDPEWALTTATCIEGASIEYLSVRAGSTTRNFGGQIVDVISIIAHPDFNRRTVDYDFALLKLEDPITVLSAAPVALPVPSFNVPTGATAYVTGWGLLSSEGVAPEILRRVEVPVVSQDECQKAHAQHSITDRMFCAGDLEVGGKDACSGDSGGPVIVQGRLAGLVSWGIGCGEPATPGVYARVSSVVGWIYQTTGVEIFSLDN